ncbi:hypothetical protein [Fictibacillus macauensis]|uniref:hypothetical protein n=1 Tax=Fictibacillus macauensis TaxID=245160 RepID=UPI0002FC6105|nr:hypothetical protein [Fictibacillus macauensis]
MNRQWTEDEMHVAELLQDIQRKIGTLHITDEDFMETVKGELPKIQQLLDEVLAHLE